MDEEVRRIKERWDKSGSIYDRSVTEAQVNIWTLLSRLRELEEENKRLSSEWQQTHDWNNQVITENQNLKTHIKKLEEWSEIAAVHIRREHELEVKVKELNEENKGMVRLTKEDMKKLG